MYAPVAWPAHRYKAKRANKNPATEDKMILPGRHMDLDAAVAWVNKRVAAKKADPTLPPITYEEITTKIPEFTSDEV